LDGQLLEDFPGALWSRDLLELCRRQRAEVPPLRRIVVGVDPAVSTSETSNLTGIVVAGLDVDGHGNVLEDASGKYSPIEWARRAVGLYHRYGADRVVAEINQGGAMVETTVRTVDPNVSFKAVNASRNKITRAEPVSALFEQRRAHLVGGFPELEDELCTFEAGCSNSPDRLDAMVWALTELMLNKQVGEGFLNYYAALAGAAHSAPREDSAARSVKMLAPPGVGAVLLFGGRDVLVPTDRIVAMSEAEARPLARAGWVRAA
jgi:phage terminase large subunit-like protein